MTFAKAVSFSIRKSYYPHVFLMKCILLSCSDVYKATPRGRTIIHAKRGVAYMTLATQKASRNTYAAFSSSGGCGGGAARLGGDVGVGRLGGDIDLIART